MSESINSMIGYYDLHSDPAVNFQLNRWINYLGSSALEEIKTILPKLSDLQCYSDEFLMLGEKAEAEGRKLHAAYYYRSAEFFMWSDNPRKQDIRMKFLQLIRQYYNISNNDIFHIPYNDGSKSVFLPAYYFKTENPRDIIVIFGGSDSYIEEFLPVLLSFRDKGFNILCFEGPGQGSVLEDSNLPMTHDWHKPVKAVLDYFQLEDITLIGISMGGCLVMRTAAFEKRVKRVVAYDVLYDANIWLNKLKPIVKTAIVCLNSLRASGIINFIFNKAMNKSMQLDWGMRQAMHIFGVDSPFQYINKVSKFKTSDVSHLIHQDVLIMAGKEDFAIPVLQFYQQIEALKNVRSLTARLFTREEHAQNHCQVGNLGLAIDTISNWIDFIKQHNIKTK